MTAEARGVEKRWEDSVYVSVTAASWSCLVLVFDFKVVEGGGRG